MLDRLWAGWRNRYVRGIDDGEFEATDEDGQSLTLFEQILTQTTDDLDGFIVHRGELVSVMLNIHPYGSGHMLVMPNRGVERSSELTDAEAAALWQTVDHAVRVCETEYDSGGVNVGLNQGKAAGAGIPDHLHVHVLPRWLGDTNFMTSIAETRVIPEDLEDTWKRLRAAWPTVTPRVTS